MCFLCIFHLGQICSKITQKNLFGGDFRRVCFFAFTEKNISLFGGELLLRQLSIQSINKFLEYRDQYSLDTRSFSAIFHSVLEVDNSGHNYQTRAANKSNLKEYFYRTVILKYSLFPFCISELNNWENSTHEAKSIKHFKSMLMQFFTFFSLCFQCMTK